VSDWTIYHNPRCSKSRQTLQLLQEHGIDADVVPYLDNPPSKQQLQSLLTQLGLSARALLRKGENVYRDLGLADPALSDEKLLDAMAAHPILIERPIVVHAGRAVLGRPPENVLKLLD
jgi:arsenate reductase